MHWEMHIYSPKKKKLCNYELQLHIIARLYLGTSPQSRSSSSLDRPHSSLNGSRDICITRPRIPRSPLRSTLSMTSSRIHPRGTNCSISLVQLCAEQGEVSISHLG